MWGKRCKRCKSEIYGVRCDNCGYVQIENHDWDVFDAENDAVEVDTEETTPRKRRVAAIMLGVLTGFMGTHNLYMGYANKAIAQFFIGVIGGLITFGITTLAVEIWAIIECIQIYKGIIQIDGNGLPLL